jgi:hypothetical protein
MVAGLCHHVADRVSGCEMQLATVELPPFNEKRNAQLAGRL